MWMHLLHFALKVISAFIEAIGSTLLGLVLDLAFAASVAAILYRDKHPGESVHTMLNRWHAENKGLLRITVYCALVFYVPAGLFIIGKSVYEDHVGLVGKVTAESTKRMVAEQKYKQTEMPKLIGTMGNIGIAPAGPKDADTVIIAWAQIRNVGAPSIADMFRLSIRKPNGEVIILDPVQLPKKTVAYQGKHVPLTEMSVDNYLVAKATNNPIPFGGMAQGFLVGAVKGINTSEVEQRGNRLFMEFSDVNGQTFEMSTPLDAVHLSIFDSNSLAGPSVKLFNRR